MPYACTFSYKLIVLQSLTITHYAYDPKLQGFNLLHEHKHTSSLLPEAKTMGFSDKQICTIFHKQNTATLNPFVRTYYMYPILEHFMIYYKI